MGTNKARAPVRTVRVSVSLPVEVHQTLVAMAEKRKVSIAWLMRDAAEGYIRDQWPLLEGSPATTN